jgi:hypothetical protein
VSGFDLPDVPPDPRLARQRAMATYLQVALAVTFTLGVATLLAPMDVQRGIGIAMVVVLIATPLVRLSWLLVRWLRRGDRRFAAAAFLLLVVMAVGMVVGR